MKIPFFSTKHKCYRLHREYSLPGYIDLFDEYKQQFRLEYYAFWGLIKYRSKVLFEEEIPGFVIIHEMFFPWGTEWRSSCPEEIRRHYHWRGQPYKNKNKLN